MKYCRYETNAEKMLRAEHKMFKNMYSTDELNDKSNISRRVKQDCICAQVLFNFFFNQVL